MLPGLGRCAAFSTSFWKIHGCEERQAFFRRTVGMMSFIIDFNAVRGVHEPGAGAPRTCILRFRRLYSVHLPTPQAPHDTPAQRAQDRRRLLRAINGSTRLGPALAAMSPCRV